MPRSGFTLLELIVALWMVTILAVVLYESMRAGFRARSSAEAVVEPARTAGLAMEFLREDLQNIVPPPAAAVSGTGTGSTGTNVSIGTTSATTATTLAGPFVGLDGRDDRGRDADDLVFYTTANGPQHQSGDGEIKMIELTVLVPDGSNDHVLVRRVTSNLLSPSTIAVNPDDEVLCRGVAGFNLRYFDGSQWQDNWDSTQNSNELPAAVEVTVTLERPAAPGQTRPLRYVRVFPLSCSSLVVDLSNQSGSGTSGGTTTGSGGTTPGSGGTLP